MVNRKVSGRLLGTGVLAIGMFGAPFALATTISAIAAPAAHADSVCGGGGGFVPGAGGSGSGCDTWTPGGNHVMCGQGGGQIGGFGGFGGGCRIDWGGNPATFTVCNGSGGAIVFGIPIGGGVNDCPYVP